MPILIYCLKIQNTHTHISGLFLREPRGRSGDERPPASPDHRLGIVGEGAEQQVGQGKTVSQSHTQNTPRQLKSSLEADVEIYLSKSSGSNKVADLLRRESKLECRLIKEECADMLCRGPSEEALHYLRRASRARKRRRGCIDAMVLHGSFPSRRYVLPPLLIFDD